VKQMKWRLRPVKAKAEQLRITACQLHGQLYGIKQATDESNLVKKESTISNKMMICSLHKIYQYSLMEVRICIDSIAHPRIHSSMSSGDLRWRSSFMTIPSHYDLRARTIHQPIFLLRSVTTEMMLKEMNERRKWE
jgi:hypothetical protein